MFGTGLPLLSQKRGVDGTFGRVLNNDKSMPLRTGRMGELAARRDSFRDAHMEVGGKPDRSKYRLKGDPLQQEDNLREMKFGPTFARSAKMKDLKFRLVQSADGNQLDNANISPAAKDQFKMGKIQELAADIAREELQHEENKMDDEFAADFADYLRGAGRDEEYIRAGWDPAKCRGKPISDHPSVQRFLADHVARHADYDHKLAQMRVLSGRMSEESRRGLGHTLDDAFKHYKYVVRNEPFNADDVHIGPPPKPLPPIPRPVAAGNG